MGEEKSPKATLATPIGKSHDNFDIAVSKAAIEHSIPPGLIRGFENVRAFLAGFVLAMHFKFRIVHEISSGLYRYSI
jgi:hypothetical protein